MPTQKKDKKTKTMGLQIFDDVGVAAAKLERERERERET